MQQKILHQFLSNNIDIYKPKSMDKLWSYYCYYFFKDSTWKMVYLFLEYTRQDNLIPAKEFKNKKKARPYLYGELLDSVDNDNLSIVEIESWIPRTELRKFLYWDITIQSNKYKGALNYPEENDSYFKNRLSLFNDVRLTLRKIDNHWCNILRFSKKIFMKTELIDS